MFGLHNIGEILGINRSQKESLVKNLNGRFNEAQVVIAAEYSGTDVTSFTQFRKRARESEVYVKVVKNRLGKIAIKDTPFDKLSEKLSGPLVYGIGNDTVGVAKLFKEFAKKNESVKITTGAIPGQLLSPAEIDVLASLPSREELMAKLVGTMQAPIAKFVRTLNEVPSKFVRTLAAVRDAKTT